MTDTKIKTKKEVMKDAEYSRDFYITKILRHEDCRDYLLKLITKILEPDIEGVENDFELIDVKLGLSKYIKNSEADVVTKSDYGYINVEVNFCPYPNKTIDNKNLSYVCELILRQVKPKKFAYKDLKRITQINLNTYDYHNKGEFIYTASLRDDKYFLKRDESLKIIDVNLDFLSRLDYNEIKEFGSDSLEWMLYVMVHNERKDLNRLYEDDEMMKKVTSKLYDLDENLDNYLLYDKEKLQEGIAWEYGYNDGLEQGIKRGIERGIEQGRQEEMEKNKKEKLEMVKMMISLNMNDEDIKKISNLSNEEFEKIKKEKLN